MISEDHRTSKETDLRQAASSKSLSPTALAYSSRFYSTAMSLVGPRLPTCAVHQSRQLSEVLRTCQASDQHGRC
jgi:hypothetical protein